MSLDEGTMPGTEIRPDYGVRDPEIADVLCAQRDHLVDVLARLVAVVPNGYMTPEDQSVLREARAELARYGRSGGRP